MLNVKKKNYFRIRQLLGISGMYGMWGNPSTSGLGNHLFPNDAISSRFQEFDNVTGNFIKIFQSVTGESPEEHSRIFFAFHTCLISINIPNLPTTNLTQCQQKKTYFTCASSWGISGMCGMWENPSHSKADKLK